MDKWGGRVAARLVRATLDRYGVVCHLCRESGATSADHIIPRSRGGADDLGNLRPAHVACNQRRGDMSLEEYRLMYGYQRTPSTRFKVVCGPPGAGKTTYVKSHAALEDIVIDLDAIAGALMPLSETTHAYTRAVKDVATAMRLTAIRVAAKQRVPVTVWLVNTLPSRAQIATYARDGWELITIDPGRDVARARVAYSDRPLAHALKNIDYWYDNRPVVISDTITKAPAAELKPSREWI